MKHFLEISCFKPPFEKHLNLTQTFERKIKKPKKHLKTQNTKSYPWWSEIKNFLEKISHFTFFQDWNLLNFSWNLAYFPQNMERKLKLFDQLKTLNRKIFAFTVKTPLIHFFIWTFTHAVIYTRFFFFNQHQTPLD